MREYVITETSPGQFQIVGPFSENVNSRIKRAKGYWVRELKGWTYRGTREALDKLLALTAKADIKDDAIAAAKAAAEVPIEIPYVDRDLAQNAGCRWEERRRTWIAPSREVAERVQGKSKAREAKRAEERAAGLAAVEKAAAAKATRHLFFLDSSPGVGATILLDGKHVTIERFGKSFRYDYEAHGCWKPDRDGDACHYGYYRPATEREVEDFTAARVAKQRRAESRGALEQLAGEIVAAGGHQAEQPEGERVDNPFDPQTLYGGGSWFAIGPAWIWSVRNNGADGDDWERNNVRTGGAGAIGHQGPFTEALAEQIRRSAGAQ
jgi:hypothetical protein